MTAGQVPVTSFETGLESPAGFGAAPAEDYAARSGGRFRRMVAIGAAAGLGVVAALGGGGVSHEAEAADDVPEAMKTVPGHLNPGDVLKVTVLEAVGGKAVSGNLTSDRTDADGYVTAYPCGETRPEASDLNPVAGQVRTNRLITYANQNGEICFYTLKGTDLIVDVDSVVDVTKFPNRRTDTRTSGDPLDPGEVLEVFIPEAVGGKTVTGNLTSTETDDNGYITGYPCDQPRPLASDLNPRQNEVVANRYIGKASQDGKICFYSLKGTHLVFDANGIVNGGTSIPNQRIDTRETGERLEAGEILRVNLFDAIGGATVLGNLTADRSTENGYVTAWNCNAGRPEKSDLNPIAGKVVANRLIVEAGGSGDICFYSLKPTDLVIDFNGIWMGTDPLRNHFRFDTRTPLEPGAGDGVEIVAAAGANYVGREDVVIDDCVYWTNGQGVWQRWLYMKYINQQPGGAAVIAAYTDYDKPSSDNEHTVTYSSVLANQDGVIDGYSVLHFTRRIPSETLAQRFVGDVALRLFENTATGRQEVGSSLLTLTTSCRPFTG